MTAVAERLDVELVRRGLARSRTRAAELVASGRVRVGGTVARKPSQAVADDATVAVDAGSDEPGFVSRGAHKLAGALDALEALGTAPRVAGALCLDAGASTGGFTQVLLARGARHVLAVDVGHGQMAPEVAQDARVTVREGVNVRALPVDSGPVDLVVADLSFISLTLVLEPLLAVTADDGHLLLMVKPQFEVGRTRLGSSGVVNSVALREEAVDRVAAAAGTLGAGVLAVVPSTLPGPAGNREYFLWLRPAAAGTDVAQAGAEDVRQSVRSAVHRAVAEDVAVLVGTEGSVR